MVGVEEAALYARHTYHKKIEYVVPELPSLNLT